MKINEKTGLYENYGLWHVPFWQTKKFLIAVEICACVVLVIAVVLLVRMYVRYKKRKKLSAWDQALYDLNVLKTDQKIRVACGKEFYSALGGIVKTYLSERFAYDVLGKTDAEVVNYLQNNHADQIIIDDIKAIAQGSEIIKFANAQAAQEQINRDYERVIAIINRTLPKQQ